MKGDWNNRGAPPGGEKHNESPRIIPVMIGASSSKPSQPIQSLVNNRPLGPSSVVPPHMQRTNDPYYRGGNGGPNRYEFGAGGNRPSGGHREDKSMPPFNEPEMGGGPRMSFPTPQQRPLLLGPPGDQMMSRHHGPSGRILEPMTSQQPPNRNKPPGPSFNPQGGMNRRPSYGGMP